MTTVYIPNVPMRRDPETREWRPSMDLHAAHKHGDVRVLFTPDEVQAGAGPCEAVLANRMADIGPDDYVLHIGDPAIMAMVVRAQMRLVPGAPLNLLKWDRFSRDYLKVTIK